MKIRSKAIAGIVLCMLAVTGCAGLGVWSTAGQATITKLVGYYNEYLGPGTISAIDAIVADAETLLGANATVVATTKAAETAAQTALSGLNTVAAAGTATNAQTDNVQAAITALNDSVGAVKTAIATASTTTATK